MMKMKLFRRGKLVGLVTPSFYTAEIEPVQSIWDDIDLPNLEA